MNKLFTKIVGTCLGLAMAVGTGVAVANGSKEAVPVHAADTTYTFTSKSWADSTSSWTSDKDGGQLTSGQGVQVTTTYSGAGAHTKSSISNITAIEFTYCTNASKGVGSISVTIGSNTAVTYSVTKVGGTTARTTSQTYATPQSGVVTFEVTCTTNSIYVAAVKITTQSTVAASINGANSVDVGTQWAPTSITEDVSGNTVSGATYAFAASSGAVISSSNTTTGAFTCSAAGTVTVSASKTGYAIASKTVTVNSSDPYINLTLTSGATAYTGQTVSITSEYGNGVAGLSWSVQSGSISGTATTSNSGYSAKISNTAGTLTIRATDTGSALYSEVSVTVTKTAFTTSPAATASVAEGKTATLTAVLNSGGTINWESDDPSVATVSGGVVTGVAEGTATITAQSADDTSVTATCTVIVTEAPAEIVIDKDSISGFASSYAERDWTSGTVSGKIHAYKNGNNIQFQASNSYMYNTVAVPGPITNITLTKASGSYTQLTLYTSDSAITSQPASGGVNNNSSWSWDLDADDGLTYFYIKSSSSSAKVVSDITITYQKVELVDPTGIELDNSSAISMDTYGYGRRKLSATVSPYNANDLTVTWGTNNSAVVTVADGVLTPVGVGTTTVYACTANYDPENPNANLIDSVSVTVTEALYKKATFTPTSTSAVTQSDDYLTGGSVTLSASSAGTWNNDKSAIQLTSGKDVTFTISGYAGMKISGVDLVVSSNGSAGSAALTVTAGTTDILEIESAAFSDASWNGAYDANACELYKATTEYVVDSGEDITFAFSASVNSIYVHSVAIRYLDYSLEQWCANFLSQITCSGGTPGSITDDSKWGTLATSFAALNDDLKELAAKATANKDSDSVIEQAMARYDLILRKYGIGTTAGKHTDFIGRFGEGTVNGVLYSRISLFGNIGSNNAVAIIVVVSMISLTSIGGYFFLRKRKEQ